jgi:sarcosine oxidase
MNFEVIIIGLGAMGSAAVYQLAKKGVKVLGLDQFSPPHNLGSTHGETRVTRQAIGEGAEYVPLAMRSYELFREIENETGADLLTITGGLIISKGAGVTSLHGNSGFIQETVSTAKKFGIEHRELSAVDINREFPQFNLDGDELGYFEDEMGFLRPESCVRAQLTLAEAYGAKLYTNEKVAEIKNHSNSVEIVTDQNRYSAEKIIISAGPWIKDFVGNSDQDLFKIYRQIFYWFDVGENYEHFKPGRFPIFIWELGRWENDFVYGFPAVDGQHGGFKVATETYLETTDPHEVSREVLPQEIDEIYQNYIQNRILNIPNKTVKTSTCLYTVTPKSRFVIDRLPENERIIIASPCSGHGFKHSAAIGEVLAELAISGKSPIDISAFAFRNFS